MKLGEIREAARREAARADESQPAEKSARLQDLVDNFLDGNVLFPNAPQQEMMVGWMDGDFDDPLSKREVMCVPLGSEIKMLGEDVIVATAESVKISPKLPSLSLPTLPVLSFPAFPSPKTLIRK